MDATAVSEKASSLPREHVRYLALVKWAGGLSIAAGLLHGILAPDHLAEWWGYGLFFLLAAVLQGLFGVRLLSHLSAVKDAPGRIFDADGSRRSFYLLGIGGNVAVIALYVVTRTVGIPFFGPAAGTTEAVTVFGVVTKSVEVVTVVLLALALARMPRV